MTAYKRTGRAYPVDDYDGDDFGSSPISDMASPADSVEFLDTNEQESIIKGLERRAQITNRIYRTCFCTVGIILSCMFWYFAYEREEFGERIGRARAQLVHALTAIGFLLVSYRAAMGRRPFLSNDNGDIIASTADTTGTGTSVGRSNRPPSVLTAEQVANLFGSGMACISDSPEKTQRTSVGGGDNHDGIGVANSPSTVAATPPSTQSSSYLQWGTTPSEQLSPQTRVIRELQKAAESRYGTSRRFDMFFVTAVIISVLELVMWSSSIIANYQLVVYEGSYKVKPHLFIFPFVLPMFVAAVEYALSLMSTTRTEIDDLYGLMYKYKKI